MSTRGRIGSTSRRLLVIPWLMACIVCFAAAQVIAQDTRQGSAPAATENAGSEGTASNAASEGTAGGEQPKVVARPNATVEQPRAFGYVVGDVLTQRVLLDLNGRGFVPAELPSPGRVGIWFERRAVRVEEDPAGRRWLRIDYQLMNSPQELKVVTLPAWKLKAADGSVGAQPTPNQRSGERQADGPQAGELRVGEWPISVAPLTPERPAARPGLGSLRPDRVAPLVVVAPIERGLRVGVAGLVLTALAWVGWLVWRNWRASAAQPFARALSEMRPFEGTAPEAWYALHRAFDATAGRAIRPESLPELFRRAPQLEPLRSQIEAFFRESGKRFFADSPVASGFSASALCRELRQIEKRHER